MRRTFVCLGDAVNLVGAADVERRRPARSTSRTDVRQEAGDAFIWEALPDLTVKGKSATIVAHALTGSLERASRRKTRYQLDLVGRRDELATLDDGARRRRSRATGGSSASPPRPAWASRG